MDYPLFDAYFKYVEDTESPIIFHRWSLLTALGAHLGRNYYLPFGDFRIFPNMYVMLIGEPGTRKSSAVKLARKAVASAGYSKFAFDKTSKEKFLMDLAGEGEGGVPHTVDSLVMDTLFGAGVGGEPKEVFVVADEFNDFAGTGNLEFFSLLGSLWDWDDEQRPFEQRFKNSKSIQIYQPTVSILGGNTHAGFAACFPPTTIGQGFLSRILLVFSEASGVKIPFPSRPSEAVRQTLVDCFERIHANVTGESTLTTEAKGMLDTLYRNYKGIDDLRFQHYSNRRFTHLLKMCLLCSAARASTEICRDDVIMANTILSFAEHKMPQALGEFGKAKDADVSAKIIAILTEAKHPLDQGAIWKQVQQDLENIDKMGQLLEKLVMANKIQWVQLSAKDKGYTLIRQVLKEQLYVDYKLLREAPKLV